MRWVLGVAALLLLLSLGALALVTRKTCNRATLMHLPGHNSQQHVPQAWQNHHIFASTLLDHCPEELVPGSWIQPATGPRQLSGGGVLPFTAEAQQAIWRHQNPADCSSARFLLWGVPPSGIGSLLHVGSVALNAALESGRILIESPGSDYTQDDFCSGERRLGGCYFLPFTNCSLTEEDVKGAREVLEGEFRTGKAGEGPRVAYINSDVFTLLRGTAPSMFHERLAGTAILPRNFYGWWRAQSVAYLVRPNLATLSQVRERFRAKYQGRTLAPGCISLYIRHGDKHVEADVFNDTVYEAQLHRIHSLNPSLSKQVFLSTEDPQTIEHFKARPPWEVSFVEMAWKPDTQKSTLRYAREHGFANEFLDALLSLDLALQCDGFISSYSSNWARLIDELRSTVRCKGHALHVDPAVKVPTDLNFNWRKS